MLRIVPGTELASYKRLLLLLLSVRATPLDLWPKREALGAFIPPLSSLLPTFVVRFLPLISQAPVLVSFTWFSYVLILQLYCMGNKYPSDFILC